MARVSFTALVPFGLSQAEWNEAIKAADLLVPFTLEVDQPQAADRIWRAKVGATRLAFRFEEADAPAAARSRSNLALYRVLLSTPGSGDIRSWAIGFSALYAYVDRTGGLFFDAETLETIPASAPGLKKQADNLLTACFADLATFYTRYPEEEYPDPGPMAVHIRAHR